MNRSRTFCFAQYSAAAVLALVASGCAWQSPMSESPEPNRPTFRQTAETAPADLQLLCAAEAAREYGVPSERVLPVSSSAEGDTFTVVLNADGAQAVCTIDNQGTILSLTRA